MELSAALNKLISHYGEKFKLLRNVDIGDLTVSVMASMKNRSRISVMGFATGREGPEACEHVFMLECDDLNDDFLKKVTSLILEAEREYVELGTDHAFTFLSVILLAEKIEPSAVALLKKYKYRRDYGKSGWILARVVVLDESGVGFCNRDGTDLKRLILKII